MAFWKKRPQFDSGVYTHRLAPFADVNGGAMEMVFETPFYNPLFSFRGPARVAGEFRPFGSGIPGISLHQLAAPQGVPFEVSEIYIQFSQRAVGTAPEPIGPEEPA